MQLFLQMIIKRWITILFLGLILLNPLSSVGDEGPSEELVTLPRLNESIFYQKIDLQTQRILRQYNNNLSAPEVSRLERVRRKTLKFLKDQNPYHHVKDLFIKHGLGVGVTAGISEFTTIIVLPAILTKAGLPILAGISAGSPSFLATVPLYLGIKSYVNRRKLTKKLGLKRLGPLDRLRDDLLGHAAKTRLLSVLVGAGDDERELHVISRSFSKFRDSPMGNIVDISELKKILMRFESPELDELLADAAGDNKALYAHLVIKQIHRNPSSLNAFNRLMKDKAKELDQLPMTSHQQTQLLLIHEKKIVIEKKKEELRKLSSSLKKEAQTKAEKAAIKSWTQNNIIDLEYLDFDISRHEYNFLAAIHNGKNIDNWRLTDSHLLVVERLRHLSRNIEEVSVVAKNKESNLGDILELVLKHNRSWLPLRHVISNDSTCRELIAPFIKI